MQLPFVLGMMFLRKCAAVVDFATSKITLNDDVTATAVELTASAASGDCQLSNMVRNAQETYERPEFAQIFVCSAK